MERRTIANLRGLRQLRTGLWLSRIRELGVAGELVTAGMDSAELARVLDRETRRIGRFGAGVERSRQRILASRQKLLKTIEKNKAITRVRLALQTRRFDGGRALTGHVPSRSSRWSRIREIEY